MAPKIDVEMVSDTICWSRSVDASSRYDSGPFCYLGYKKYLKAVDHFKAEGGNLDFSLHFEPFKLDPTLPLDHGVVKRDRYIAKFGGAERVAAMEQQMIARGREVGIEFSYGGKLRATRDSHRLLAKAYELGGEAKQRALAERLFADYFEKECVTATVSQQPDTRRQDIGDLDVLVKASAESDVLDADAARTFLRSDEGTAEYEQGVEHSRGQGISGVPFFIFTPSTGKRLAVSGAQDPETFVQVR